LENLGIQFSSLNPSAQELQQKLELLRPVYDKACMRLRGEDPDWEVKKAAMHVKISRLVKSFDGKSDAGAAYILGQIRSMIDELDQPRLIKAEWDTYRQRWESILPSNKR